MRNRHKLNLKEITPSGSDTQLESNHSSFFKKFSHIKSIFKKQVTSDVAPVTELSQLEDTLQDNLFNQSHPKEDEKDWWSVLLFVIALFGLESFLTSSYTPAFGKDSFLGLDIAFVWYFLKSVSMLAGGYWLVSIIFKIRGPNYILNKVFKMVPDFIKSKLAPISIFFFSTVLLSTSLLIFYPQLFKSTSEWNRLEAAKIDSPSPLKRAEFSGLIFQDEGKTKQFSDNTVTPKIYIPSPPSVLEQYPNQSKPSPDISVENLSAQQQKELKEFKQLQEQFYQQMLDDMETIHQALKQKKG